FKDAPDDGLESRYEVQGKDFFMGWKDRIDAAAESPALENIVQKDAGAERPEQSYSERVEELREQQQQLKRISELAGRCELAAIANVARKSEQATARYVATVMGGQVAMQGRTAQYHELLMDANKLLRDNPSAGALRRMRERLETYRNVRGLGKERREGLGAFIKTYTMAIGRREKEQQKQQREVLGTVAKVALGAACLYLGYVGIRSLSRPIDEKISAYQEEKARRLGEGAAIAAFEKHTASYKQSEGELAAIRSQIEQADDLLERKRDEMTLLDAQKQNVQEGIGGYLQATEASPVARRLRPVLHNAAYTVYIEKSNNRTHVLDDDGNVLMRMRHTDARNPLRKTRAGQERTPEGCFGIYKSYLNKGDWKHDLYGVGFYSLDYENPNGSRGVILCSAADRGTERAINTGEDVMNCGVAFHDDDFKRLHGFIGNGSTTQVVIEDSQARPLRALGDAYAGR
ncbi:hypothetical protein GF367_03090, partial [Candidatus Woesearchaeota archaeon]|nr:hypothetical protein [Candidatus Woesearchaeota archaeon]